MSGGLEAVGPNGVFAEMIDYLKKCEAATIVTAQDIVEKTTANMGGSLPKEFQQALFHKVMMVGAQSAIKKLNEVVNEKEGA